MSGKFLLNSAAFVACRASKILLCVGQLIRIEAKLCFGNIEIACRQ